MSTNTSCGQVEKVAVIGAGTIGASWASVFLSRGLEVRVYDPRDDVEAFVRRYVDQAWPIVTKLKGADPDGRDRLGFCDTVARAVNGVDMVQESGPENLALKRALLEEIGETLPGPAIVASSSSGLLVSEMQAGLGFAERLVLGHPFNPPHLMPLVEVVGGKSTDESVIGRAIAFYRGIGKHPIRLHREVPGHVANRLAAALWREAIHLAAEGVASVADIDAAVREGPGLRWACMGPHLTYHLGGGQGGLRHFIEHLGPAFEQWWAELGEPKLTAETINILCAGVEVETAGRTLASLAVERDQALLAILDARGRTERSR